MRSLSSSKLVAPFPTSQQFLIPPFARFQFTIAFTLATGVGWFLIWLVLRSGQDPLMPPLAVQKGVGAALIAGLVSGLVVSTMQWLVLRRYLRSPGWIVAGTIGYVFLTITLEKSWQAIGLITNAPSVTEVFEAVSPAIVILAAAGMRAFLTALSATGLGFTQWLFLRPYTRSNLWWFFIPSLSVLLSSSFAFLSVLLLWAGVKLPLEVNVLAAGILGSTQAIAICNLKKRTVSVTLREHNSPLLIAPEILDYGLVHTLAQQLQRRLNSAWTTEHLNDDSLTYLVGVTQTGAIAAYSPINLPAVEQVNEIPLPELTSADRLRRQAFIEPLARFEVTFLPSGSLQINAWCGVPLMKVAWSMLIATLSLSAIASVSIGLIT